MTGTGTDLIRLYKDTVKGMGKKADDADLAGQRAKGGVLRATKGNLVEVMATQIVEMAWAEAGGARHRLAFEAMKTFRVNIQEDYVANLPSDIREYVEGRIKQHYYRAKIDVKAFVDGELVLGIECKAYTENAMLKRILIDFRMLKTLFPNLVCVLLQLESQLGGSYSNPGADPQYGSPSSHTLMSYFPDVSLNIITLLEGERRIKQPIHDPEYFKNLFPENLDQAIIQIRDLLAPFA